MDDLPRELVDRAVVPFYLQMMGEAALTEGRPLLPEIARVAEDTTPREVAALLGQRWRPCVMGAWLSVRYRGRCIEDALLASIGKPRGQESLTAAPLAMAACLVVGDRAVSALLAYVTQELGPHGPIASALEHLGAPVPGARASLRDREMFEQMLQLGQELQSL